MFVVLLMLTPVLTDWTAVMSEEEVENWLAQLWLRIADLIQSPYGWSGIFVGCCRLFSFCCAARRWSLAVFFRTSNVLLFVRCWRKVKWRILGQCWTYCFFANYWRGSLSVDSRHFWTATTWSHRCSLHIADSTVLRQQWQQSTAIWCWRRM